MSIHDQLYSRFSAAQNRFHNRSIVYVDTDGTETTVTASVGEIVVNEQDLRTGRDRHRSLNVKLPRAQVANPSDQAFVKIDGAIWSISEITEKSATHSVLVCVENLGRVRGRDLRSRS